MNKAEKSTGYLNATSTFLWPDYVMCTRKKIRLYSKVPFSCAQQRTHSHKGANSQGAIGVVVSMGKEVAVKALVYRPTTDTSAADKELLALWNSAEVQVGQARSLKWNLQ